MTASMHVAHDAQTGAGPPPAASCCFSAAFSASSCEILSANVWSVVWSIAPVTSCDTSASAAATVAANRMSIADVGDRSHGNESTRKEINQPRVNSSAVCPRG